MRATRTRAGRAGIGSLAPGLAIPLLLMTGAGTRAQGSRSVSSLARFA